jgi:heme-degrading monooxygenase HmoA
MPERSELMTDGQRTGDAAPPKVGLVAFHYPRREYAAEMLRRICQAAKFITAAPGCLGADCWLTEDGAAIVTTGQWESAQAFEAGFAAARAAGIDFRYDEREARPRKIFRLADAGPADT